MHRSPADTDPPSNGGNGPSSSDRGRPVYEVNALAGYNLSDQGQAAAEALEVLESVIEEATYLLESAGVDRRRWYFAMFCSVFEAADGTRYSGLELLETHANCFNKLQGAGASPVASIDAFRDTVENVRTVTIPRPFSLSTDGEYKLPRTVKEIVTPFERSVDEIEGALEAVFENHFAGDPFEFSQGTLESTEYRFSTGLMIRGRTLLEALSVARWKKEFSDEPLPARQSILETAGYRPEDVLSDFRKRALQRAMNRESFGTVIVNAPLNAVQQHDLDDLEALAVEAVLAIAAQQPGLLNEAHVNLAVLRDSNGNECSFIRLLTFISVNRWRENKPDKADIPVHEVIRKRGYRFVDIVRNLVKRTRQSSAQTKRIEDFFGG